MTQQPTCPEHPTQPAIHCACPAGAATHPCEVCERRHTGPTCGYEGA